MQIEINKNCNYTSPLRIVSINVRSADRSRIIANAFDADNNINTEIMILLFRKIEMYHLVPVIYSSK